jgi:DNA polymerase III delta prime subunit
MQIRAYLMASGGIEPEVSAEKLELLKEALKGNVVANRKLARMFPDNPVIASAAQQKDAAE